MNDMRLPGVVPFSADTPAGPGAQTPRDPAEAFDAVMSRYANAKTLQNPPAPAERARNASQNDPLPARTAQPERNVPPERSAQPERSTPAAKTKEPAPDKSKTETAPASTPAANDSDGAHGKPAARSKPEDGDADDCATTPTVDAQTLDAATLAATSTAAPATGTYSIAHSAINAPVGTAAFADELSQRVVMFAGQKLQRADIAVTPADLGPIAVSIEVRGQEATLAFAAASAATRAAIEDALPRLRDMLSAQGLQLAGTHVGGEPRRDAYRPARGDTSGSGARRSNDGVAAVATTDGSAVRRRVNLIDIEV